MRTGNIYFVRFSDTHKGRTTELKSFYTLREAKEFLYDLDTRTGYIMDYNKNSLKQSRNFMPTATEVCTIKSISGLTVKEIENYFCTMEGKK